MQTSTCWIVVMIMTTGIAVAQPKSNDRVKIFTVCEILGDVADYADAAVAVVGRMERTASLIDRYEFLSQQRCPHPVITHGHVWSDKIQILGAWEAGMLKPPANRPQLEGPVVAAKLSIVRETTKLDAHPEPQTKPDAHSIERVHISAAPNEWAVVYGRIAIVANLHEDCGAEGCGGDNVPLAIIAEPYNLLRIGEDGSVLP